VAVAQNVVEEDNPEEQAWRNAPCPPDLRGARDPLAPAAGARCHGIDLPEQPWERGPSLGGEGFPHGVEEAGIKDVRLHDTRHTFASRLAIEGADLLAIKELGGWKTLSTVQRYAHLSPGHQRKAIERLATRAVVVTRPAEAANQE
jgi:integrase-like protein